MRRLGWVVVLLLGVARAQDAGTQQQAVPQAVTASEKLDFAREVVEEMEQGVKEVRKLLEAAEKEGGPEQITCVKDRLSSLEALREVTLRAQAAMTEALAANQVERADHELRKIGVAISKFRQFRSEAGACLGRAGVQGTTEVAVNEAAVGDEGETDELRASIFEGVEDPPEMTPFE